MKKLLMASFLVVSCTYGAVVKSLEFEGLVHLSPEVASEMIGISVGNSVDIEMIDEAIKKLYKQNYFDDIWVEDGSDGKLIFHFLEKPTVANVEITGVGENDKEKVLETIGIKKGEVYDKEKAELAKLKIVKFYEAKGYFDTVVEVDKKELNKDALSLNFIINRGEEIFIQSLNLCGSKNLEYSDFEPYIANKKPELLPWMWGFNDGKLRLSDLEYDSERIKDVYMQNGYMDAVVSNPYLRAYMDSYTATLTYNISEGKQYKVASLDIQLPEKLLDKKALLDELVLQKDQVFNVSRLRKDVAKVKRAVADLGYAYVSVYPDVQTNKEKALANITLIVTPGEKVYINDVRIEGNTRTIDRAVRREIYLAHGDLYSQTDMDDSVGALKRTSYFENVYIEQKKVSKDKIDLIVHVKEANTGAISGGIGYGSSDGLLLSASVSDSNIFGSGIKASVNIDRSDKELNGRITLTNPRVNDSVYSLSGSVYSTDSDYYYYDEKKLGFSLTAGRKLNRFTSASLSYVLESAQYSNFEGYWAAFYTSDYSAVKSSIMPAISFNNTDDYYLPRRGINTSLAIEFAGIGGDEKFTKTTAKFAYFYGLQDAIDYDLILRYRAKAQYVSDNGELPLGERLYMGGISTIRGYESSSISPEDSDGTLLGGTMMFANSVEASFPLIERLKMRGAVFFDYGMIGDDNLDIKRAGTGFNLEWVSPMGPILLIFSKALMTEDGDRTSSFEFTMGRTF